MKKQCVDLSIMHAVQGKLINMKEEGQWGKQIEYQ